MPVQIKTIWEVLCGGNLERGQPQRYNSGLLIDPIFRTLAYPWKVYTFAIHGKLIHDFFM